MQITDILVHKVNLPLVTGYRWASGVYLGATKGSVEVHTDAGIVGWGEVATVEQADIVAHEFAPRLNGVDPSNIDDCCRRCLPEIRTLLNTHDAGLVKAFGGLELALWDIKGKALNLPIYSLLGGPVRREIGFSEYFALRVPSATESGESTPFEVARYCAWMRTIPGRSTRRARRWPGSSRLILPTSKTRPLRFTIWPNSASTAPSRFPATCRTCVWQWS